MTTQYKWLPSEPAEEMTMAWCANCHAWDLDAYKAMWQAAPEVDRVALGREPLDDETILGIARTIPNLSGDDSALIRFARELGV